MMLKKFATLCGVGLFALFSMVGAVYADDDDKKKCPVGLVNGMTLEEEFGPGVADVTRCLKKTKKVKLVIQINNYCRNDVSNISECPRSLNPEVRFGRAYALGNINNVIKDYEITHGMKVGKDYEIAAIVHSGGGYLMTKHNYAGDNGNKFEGDVLNLMERGVKFYYCQNTVRGFIRAGRLTEGMVTEQLIPGVEFVTAGISALADFQKKGWTYVQP